MLFASVSSSVSPSVSSSVCVRDALSFARERIGPVDARALLQHVTGFGHARFASAPERQLDPRAWQDFEALVVRRAAGEPVAYLIGWREFYGRRFSVTPDVLIPRPETELLVDLVLRERDRAQRLQILDLGTGSGVLAITMALELPRADVTATDVSPAALAVARGNADALGARVHFIESDWWSALADRRFDLIVSNPPYIAPADPHLGQGDLRFEPRGALVGRGRAGAGDLAEIVRSARANLRPFGSLLVEHGWDQGAAVRASLSAAGFDAVTTTKDLGGNDRATSGISNPEAAPAPRPADPRV
ncbi:MAG: peptide chain release factor N(5)-glutamine methyltransferase [Sterolibacteriaceae bacterium]|uniref:Release factor glutamine methyltransferase n=1 Tax=Candidatus Methylophosphatis roskildensis TaxID=2899263 RepID=A0A9D7HW86_9PROT|nr:peptide chain release factor N(5)-glutamine methyltransferase [Candidatus Methylophosphatis roskildensis]MBK7235371.1 peptide chain release factor N(5)-glutamine methyltransferase [Sterolibacteriaceae bacterium]